MNRALENALERKDNLTKVREANLNLCTFEFHCLIWLFGSLYIDG